ncbi:hypothetical protein MMC19_001444 [Ptychographa xylographoides]|nr:hypothetical protein [Ptychographa xylographoides]
MEWKKGGIADLRRKAGEELALDRVFGKEWWGADGVWLFDVPGLGARSGTSTSASASASTSASASAPTSAPATGSDTDTDTATGTGTRAATALGGDEDVGVGRREEMEEEGVTIEAVAAAHPVIRKWTGIVEGVMRDWAVRRDVFSGEEWEAGRVGAEE